MKLDERIKCPHCNGEDFYRFRDNDEMLICHFCEKPFDISIQIKVEVVSKIPTRLCYICERKFIANDTIDDLIECPYCNYKGNHFNVI